jgi:hypothetical protein
VRYAGCSVDLDKMSIGLDCVEIAIKIENEDGDWESK